MNWLKNKGCIVVNDLYEFQKVLNTLFSDPLFRDEKGRITKKYIEDNIGATPMILDYISNKIGN